MAKLVSLFRAINVGGRNRVKMDDLKTIHEGLGLKNVKTFLQTGNVIFDSDKTDDTKLAVQIEEALEAKCGFRASVIVRSLAELKETLDHDPFHTDSTKATTHIVVIFLSDAPTEAAKQDLLTSYKGPEEMVIVGKNMYTYYTNDIGHSKLTAALIEKKLKVTGTGRNWNTVTKLIELAEG